MFNILKKKLSEFKGNLLKEIKGKETEEKKQEIEKKTISEKEIKETKAFIKEKETEEKKQEIEKKTISEKTKEKIITQEQKQSSEESDELRIRIGVKSKLKKLITRKIKLTEKELNPLLERFEFSLLEADVSIEVAKKIKEKIKNELNEKEIPEEKINEVINETIKNSLNELIKTNEIDLIKEINKKIEKPFTIIFLGPNGSGKTTSIAKIANYLKEKNKKVILAAGDTFRAAAIEQLEKHAIKLGIPIIKQKYLSDPAAVAFDAIQAAKARNYDVVLIDSSGRQETNTNLMNELKKIIKVSKADLKLFVGEAIAGHVLLEQSKKYDEEINLDGFVLTKIDCDVKGGTAINLLSEIKKPILFVGNGQGYNNLIEFTKEFIIKRIIN